MVVCADTGTDFAWAWNAPLMQIGAGRLRLLVTSGRAFFVSLMGLVLGAALRSRLLLGLTFGWIGSDPDDDAEEVVEVTGKPARW